MTYIHGDLVTGFTLELDGDHEAIDRIWTAIQRAMQAEIDREHREQMFLWSEHDLMEYPIRPLMPVGGELRLRTTPATQEGQPGPPGDGGV